MSRTRVCSASPEYRSACEAGCESCFFLIDDRRFTPVGKVQWTRNERRSLTNLLPLPGMEFAGVTLASGDTFRKVKPAAWQLLALLLSFNVIDCLMTARALSLGYAEANPFMAALFSINLPAALFAKTLVVGLGAYLLWIFRDVGIASRGLTVLTVAYGLLVAYHLSFQLVI